MDEIDKYLEENLLCKENILKLVSDYDLFCEYIGEDLEIGTKYSSPLREGDDDPSFVLFHSNYLDDTLMFKDHAKGTYGTVFDFLELFLGLDSYTILDQINSDLQLGLDGQEMGVYVPVIKKRIKVKREEVTIKITSREKLSRMYLSYWDSLDITVPICELYEARDTKVLHFITKTAHKTVVPKELCIAYEIFGHYKTYQPQGDRGYKFRNNYPAGFVEGAKQLTKGQKFVIITKSTKECMFFRQHFGWEACAGTSENTMISDFFMDKLFEDYEKVFIWLDIDTPGQAAQAKYVDKYPNIIPIVADKYPEFKDPTDIYYAAKKEGWTSRCLSYIRSLIKEGLENGERQ